MNKVPKVGQIQVGNLFSWVKKGLNDLRRYILYTSDGGGDREVVSDKNQ